MRLSFILLSFFSFALTINLAKASALSEQWIAIEPTVISKIKKSFIPVFNYKEKIEGPREVFFKVDEKELSKISHFVHHTFNRCGGFRVINEHPLKYLKQIKNKSLASEFGYYPFQKELIPNYEINQESLVNQLINQVSVPYMNSVVEHLTSYHTRYYKSPEGVLALKWIANEWSRLTQHRNDVSVDLYQYKTHDQPTVILTINGTHPEKKDKIIVLGGHGDSINTDDEGAHSHAPGADDNAAGIAVLSDIIKVIMENNYAPEHTIQFIAYAAEEVGIQGAYELTRDYREKQKKVLGVIQFDGVNYNPGTSYKMALISDSTNKDQNLFVAGLIDKYLQISWAWEECGYGCSDHAAWNYEGYRASFPVEAINSQQNPFIHTAQDTFDKSNYSTEHASLFTKLGIAYLIELDK